MINTKENLENEIATINEEFGLEEESGVVTTTSLKVAEVYGKDHADVMKKIRHFIEVIPELNDGNFSLVEYKVKCAQCIVWIAKGLQCLSINLLETKH